MPHANRNEEGSMFGKYTGIREHGMSVWVVEKVKVRLDELKCRSRNKIGCRTFTNAALEVCP
jgi:hypothetical protein